MIKQGMIIEPNGIKIQGTVDTTLWTEKLFPLGTLFYPEDSLVPYRYVFITER